MRRRQLGGWRVLEQDQAEDVGKAPGEPPTTVRAAFSDELFVFEFAQAGMNATEPLLARLDGQSGGPSLRDQPRFASSLAARAGGLQLWLDLQQCEGVQQYFVNASAASDDDASRRFNAFLLRSGLLDIEDLSASSQTGAEGTRFDLQLRWPAGGTAQEALQFLFAPGDGAAMTALKPDALSVLSWRVDLARLFDVTLRELLASGAVSSASAVSSLSSFEDSVGFTLRDELLEVLDGQITIADYRVEASEDFVLNQKPGVPPHNYVILLGLKDAPAFSALFDALLRRRGLLAARESAQVHGFEAFHVQLFPAAVLDVAINYAVLPDKLVLSPSPTLLQETLARCADAGLPTIAGREDVSRLRSGLPGEGGLLQLSDMGQFAYKVTSGLVAFKKAALTVPEPSVFERHVGGLSVFSVTADAAGLKLKLVSP